MSLNNENTCYSNDQSGVTNVVTLYNDKRSLIYGIVAVVLAVAVHLCK